MRTREERFWNKVDKAGDCWIWTASVYTHGYGQFYHSPERGCVRAHIFAFETCIGPVPDGLVLHHTCENKGCVNPSHLEPIRQSEHVKEHDSNIFTQREKSTHCKHGHPLDGDNLIQRRGKHRGCRECKRRAGRERAARLRKGLPDRRRVLTAEQVIVARQRFAQGDSRAEIARSLGVSTGTVFALLNGITWKHVGEGSDLAPTNLYEAIAVLDEVAGAKGTHSEISNSTPRNLANRP